MTTSRSARLACHIACASIDCPVWKFIAEERGLEQGWTERRTGNFPRNRQETSSEKRLQVKIW